MRPGTINSNGTLAAPTVERKETITKQRSTTSQINIGISSRIGYAPFWKQSRRKFQQSSSNDPWILAFGNSIEKLLALCLLNAIK